MADGVGTIGAVQRVPGKKVVVPGIPHEEMYSGWFGVRCVFWSSEEPAYEERITLWRAADFDEAIELAEREAAEYAENIGLTFAGLSQAYALMEEPGQGAEVFSLFRASNLGKDEYLDRLFATGDEFQRSVDEG